MKEMQGMKVVLKFKFDLNGCNLCVELHYRF